jgi:type I restriction enzyme R subunit
MCQFKPDHNLNPKTLHAYEKNILRVVPELVYSPYATKEHLESTGSKAKAYRIDLVLFLNGIPIVTLELKSEFKQSVDSAIWQYKTTRLPKDPETHKPEPLLTFKRGALVHFAVSQDSVSMATKLAGKGTFFLPFNKGTSDGGAGNDTPEDDSFPTSYLWEEVLQRDNILNIIGRFIHLEIQQEEDWDGKKSKKETLIFPRYHQWNVVTKLLQTTREEGSGQKYQIQHSAGSGKSNSIAWSAHQLASLYDDKGEKFFDSVLVLTDRTVLDSQLQDTIYQFEHQEGVVGRINRDEGDGSKSSQLEEALSKRQPIIIVTIQTFGALVNIIENSATLKERKYAIIADEAHSSQTGSTARKMKSVLSSAQSNDEEEITAEDMLQQVLESRKTNPNLSYYAFTATPKSKTLEMFGRLPKPDEKPSKDNKPEAFHVYSMRQAIEEGFILDVLQNYTTYNTAYKLAQKQAEADKEVDSKKASKELGVWVKLHAHNIGQRVRVIVEHFRKNVAHLLNGQAKAMVVTSSRLEAVKYMLGFNKYIKENKYTDLQAMIAFSGEIVDDESATSLSLNADHAFNEKNMNPNLKGRDMRKAFATDEYQVMIVANKFQTGFDQPKLCAMYVLKQLKGVECVQTLSRLNRVYKGKKEAGTFVLDFVNEESDILESFKTYYKTASLTDVSDPNMVYQILDKLKAMRVFQLQEVDDFWEAFYNKRASSAKLTNCCRPAKDRWTFLYTTAIDNIKRLEMVYERTKATNDPVLLQNAEGELKDAKAEKDKLVIFKKDLGTFSRFYEFISQIEDFGDPELEKHSLFCRHLQPLLRETKEQKEEVDLSNVDLTHYRMNIIRQGNLGLHEQEEAYGLDPANDLGSGRNKDKKKELLSVIVEKFNEVFEADGLTDADMINYVQTVVDKVKENTSVMDQVKNNSKEQAMPGDFQGAVEDAVIASDEIRQEIVTQYLYSKQVQTGFANMIFDMLKQTGASS